MSIKKISTIFQYAHLRATDFAQVNTCRDQTRRHFPLTFSDDAEI